MEMFHYIQLIPITYYLNFSPRNTMAFCGGQVHQKVSSLRVMPSLINQSKVISNLPEDLTLVSLRYC